MAGVLTSEECYALLREEIVAGKLMPNERLVEAELTSRLSVGRATVRTALARLEQDGLIVHERHRGARVRLVTEEEAIEITQTRVVLEGLAARQVALHATDTDIAEIRAIHAEMPHLLAEGDLLGYSDANGRLHARILEASRHETVQRLIATLKAQVVRFQYRTILVPGRSESSLREHTDIVEAIADRDSVAAEQAMREHLTSVTEALSKAGAQPHV